MADISLDSLMIPLFTSAYYDHEPYEAYEGFQSIEADIRAAHPEKYTPIHVEDSRFSHSSWMRTHAWALTYLTLWCAQSTTLDGVLTGKQYFMSLTMKPVAAIFDGAVNTALLPAKCVVLIDRTLKAIANAFLQFASPGAPTVMDALYDTGTQSYYMVTSLTKLMFQPVNIVGNFVSPKWDLIGYIAGTSKLGYSIFNEDTCSTELLLDQGRVQYLRERCGWQHITDDVLKASGARSSRYALSYFDRNDKICIRARWEQHVQVGNSSFSIPHEHRNY